MKPLTLLSRCAWRPLLLVAVLIAAVPAGRATTPPWPDAAFTTQANNVRLEDVLREFAASFSLGLELGNGVGGVVNGRFNTRNPTEFINRLAGVYGFSWFTHAGTLYVSRSRDVVTRALSISSTNLPNLRQALTDLNVLDPRFGWGELTEQGVALVSGPPAYVELIERTLASLPAVAGGQQVAVFRLRHASVEDRSILYRDREITTPGLATVLRNLILGTGSGSASNNEALAAIAAPLRTLQSAAPLAPTAGINGSSAGSSTVAQTPGTNAPGPNGISASARAPTQQRTRAPSIQGDARINAVIVQDIPERIPIYAKLIAQLDVPTALIEIEALIIDINTSRLEELGIDWAGRSGRTAAGFGNVDQPLASGTLSIVTGPVGAAVNPSTVLVDAGNYLVARIRALEGLGDAQIQSRPSVLTLDNVGALIDLSETFYIRTTGERVATVTPITAGTTLRVTPRVIETEQGARAVRLVVDIEDGRIQDRVVDSLPTVRRSTVSTQATVGENATLLIGGYNTDQRIEQNNRVPVLGQIPLVGAFFSNRTTDVQKRERLFMIRPKVIAMPGAPVPGTSAPPTAPR